MTEIIALDFKDSPEIRSLLKNKDEPDSVQATADELTGADKGPYLVCRQCTHRITPLASRISIQDRHVHVCANPLGLLFEIGCFARAPGCRPIGLPSLEFTWFPGHAWQIVTCSSCQTHLGWFFQNPSGGGFFGLILQRLIQTDRSDD